MYKLIKNPNTDTVNVVNKIDGQFMLSIPFAPDNTDYQNFKRDIADGAELQDADGSVMSADAAKAFVATLP